MSAVPWITSVGAVIRAQLAGAVAGREDRGELAGVAGGAAAAVEGSARASSRELGLVALEARASR